MPKIIGLTGGIGAGKTTVAQIFACLGIPVFNADEQAKLLMQNNPEIKNKLILQFGEILYDQNQLNKSYLASIVFSNPDQLKKLNAIVHPITIQASMDWAQQQKAAYVIKEAALIFESNAKAELDFVIGVTAPIDLRIQRVMQRDHCTQKEVEHRMIHQMDENLKMNLCDQVIVNDDVQLIIPQVLKIHDYILANVVKA